MRERERVRKKKEYEIAKLCKAAVFLDAKTESCLSQLLRDNEKETREGKREKERERGGRREGGKKKHELVKLCEAAVFLDVKNRALLDADL